MNVGILGGGQLGLMLSHALEKLGVATRSLEADATAPAHLRLANALSAPLSNPQALESFFDTLQCATYETENLPASCLLPYADKLRPSLSVLLRCQNRIDEKNFLAQHHFPTARFEVLAPGACVHAALKKIGFPAILKTATGGYDGKGQIRLASEEALLKLDLTAPIPRILEEALTLHAELSCIVARFSTGQSHCFPVFENLHLNHILDFTLLPSRFPVELQNQAMKIALGIAEALDVCGLLTVEFFVVEEASGKYGLLVNELAPRPHNSGHITRKAMQLSQFDALAHVLTQTPLPPPALLPGCFCMGNLLGNVWLSQKTTGPQLRLDAWAHFPEVLEVYLYGKKEARPERKMGHFILKADSPERALSSARAFREALSKPVLN